MKRKYLTGDEVACLLQSASSEMSSSRDCCMIGMAFWHGLRVSELTTLRLEDYDPLSQCIQIRRLKGGLSTTHPLIPRELELLHTWLARRPHYDKKQHDWLFLSDTGGPVSRQAFHRQLDKYGRQANLTIHAHPHMLRHACGYELAEQGLDTRLIQDYLGHRNIRHTVHYTASNAARFANVWQPPDHCLLR